MLFFKDKMQTQAYNRMLLGRKLAETSHMKTGTSPKHALESNFNGLLNTYFIQEFRKMRKKQSKAIQMSLYLGLFEHVLSLKRQYKSCIN